MSSHPVSIAESEEEQVRDLAQLMLRQRAALSAPMISGMKSRTPCILLLSVLKMMQEGKAVSIVPQMQELTT